MPPISPCVPCCDTPQTTNVPGVAGASAITVTGASFVVPAVGLAVAITVGDSSFLQIGGNLFIGGANFRISAINGSTSISAKYVKLPTDTVTTGATVPAGTIVSQGLGTYQVPETLAAVTSLTDNSTGAATSTIAAGVGVQQLKFPHTWIGGTAAVEPVTNFTVGYKFKILSWVFVTEVLLVGAAGSRVANMEINTTDVGTIPSTITVPIANATVGTVTAGTAVAGANTGGATDTVSIEIQNGGTAFTAGSGTFIITVQNMDTADAVASLASKENSVLGALR